MDDGSFNVGNSKLDEEPPKEVCLVLLKDLNLTAAGKVTGRIYLFPGAGSVCGVDERDVAHLLAKKQTNCCGSLPSPYFEVME